jgi:long-chain acyl-CoA synthetase
METVNGVSCNPPLPGILLADDSLLDHLVAFAVPEPEKFASFASKITGRAISATSISDIASACDDEKVTAAVLEELIKFGKSLNFKSYEIPRGLKLRAEPFAAENGFLTPTFKMKRNEAKMLLAKEIDELYSQSSRPKAILSKL